MKRFPLICNWLLRRSSRSANILLEHRGASGSSAGGAPGCGASARPPGARPGWGWLLASGGEGRGGSALPPSVLRWSTARALREEEEAWWCGAARSVALRCGQAQDQSLPRAGGCTARTCCLPRGLVCTAGPTRGPSPSAHPMAREAKPSTAEAGCASGNATHQAAPQHPTCHGH